MSDTTSSLYDLTLLKEQYGGSEELIRRMAELFVTNTPVSVVGLRKALAEADWDSVRALAHKMKPSLDMMGVESLKGEVREIERLAAVRERLSEVSEMTEHLCRTLEAVVTAIKKDFSF